MNTEQIAEQLRNLANQIELTLEQQKPSTPSFQLPPPPPGMSWHREDGWTEEMLPQGYRPLVLGETGVYEVSFNEGSSWKKGSAESSPANKATILFWRTTRSLIFTHEGKTWTWHRPGDPMPCDADDKVHTIFRCEVKNGTIRVASSEATKWDWSEDDEDYSILGWRYADEPKPQVPLGPEDVPPGSVVRGPADGTEVWAAVTTVASRGIGLTDGRCISHKQLQEDNWLINRSIPLTGKWNPDAWEACSKPA